MKILIEFLWGTEAAPVFSYGLAAGLKDNGHDVCCILLEETENRTQWVETFGEEHLFFVRTTPKRKDPLRSGVRSFSDCLKIRSKFRRICFDLTIRTFFNPYDQYILRFVRTNKNALICHDPVPHEGMDARAAKMNREALCRADDLIVLTKAFIPVAAEEYGTSRRCL